MRSRAVDILGDIQNSKRHIPLRLVYLAEAEQETEIPPPARCCVVHEPGLAVPVPLEPPVPVGVEDSQSSELIISRQGSERMIPLRKLTLRLLASVRIKPTREARSEVAAELAHDNIPHSQGIVVGNAPRDNEGIGSKGERNNGQKLELHFELVLYGDPGVK